MKLKGAFVLVFFYSILPYVAYTCSAFSIIRPKGTFVAKSFDWDFGHGLVIANKRGMSKKALISPPNVPAEWISKYGSLTFNQVGRDMPQEGMNEKGLVVEVLWLRSAEFPAPNKLLAVNELQWVQYQLDNYATVDEVMKNLNSVNVTSKIATIHYFVCDVSGSCATIEPIKGKLVVHTDEELAAHLLTNDTYEDSDKFSKQYTNVKNISELPQGAKSLARFARLKYDLIHQNHTDADTVAEAFANLKDVYSDKSDNDDDKTQWSLVYDLATKKIHYKTLQAPQEKIIDLTKLDFNCAQPTLAANVNLKKEGDTTSKLKTYTTAMNLEVTRKSLLTGYAHLPTEVVDKIAQYPESEKCNK